MVLEDRVAIDENRLTVVETRVDLTRQDLTLANSRINYVVSRAAEDGDAILNEKYGMSL